MWKVEDLMADVRIRPSRRILSINHITYNSSTSLLYRESYSQRLVS